MARTRDGAKLTCGVIRRSMDSFFGLSLSVACGPAACGVAACGAGVSASADDEATASTAARPTAGTDIRYDDMVNPVLGRRMARPSYLVGAPALRRAVRPVEPRRTVVCL
jgi:hypothetical protein